MRNTIIIRYAELALKGKNRLKFEHRLVANIRDCLKKNNVNGKILRKRNRIYIYTTEKCKKLSNVFGISSFSYAVEVDFFIENIQATIKKLVGNKRFNSFRISANRLDKSVDDSSQKINNEIGQFVVDEYNKQVSLKEFDLEIGIDIQEKMAYVYLEKIPGPGGLPLGINGKALALIEDNKSILASWLMMKRGLRIYPVAAKKQDISLLEKYNYGYDKLELQITNEIALLAKKMKINSIVVGQTLTEIDDYGLDSLILRPLIGFSDKEITDRFNKL